MFTRSLMDDSEVIDSGFMFNIDVVNNGVVLFDQHLNTKLQLLDHHWNNLLWALTDYVLIYDFGIRYDSFRLFLMLDVDVLDCDLVFDVDIQYRRSVFFDQHFDSKLQLFDFLPVIYNSIFVDNLF